MERISLTGFLICMPFCASIVLFGIWFGEQLDPPEWIFKIAATAFVLGLASFLLLAVSVARRFVSVEE